MILGKEEKKPAVLMTSMFSDQRLELFLTSQEAFSMDCFG